MSDEKIPVESYSRVTGYIRQISAWNPGKQQENKERCFFKVKND